MPNPRGTLTITSRNRSVASAVRFSDWVRATVDVVDRSVAVRKGSFESSLAGVVQGEVALSH